MEHDLESQQDALQIRLGLGLSSLGEWSASIPTSGLPTGGPHVSTGCYGLGPAEGSPCHQRPQSSSPEVTGCPSKGKQKVERGVNLLRLSGGREAEGKAPAQQGVPLLDTPQVVPTLWSEAQALA